MKKRRNIHQRIGEDMMHAVNTGLAVRVGKGMCLLSGHVNCCTEDFRVTGFYYHPERLWIYRCPTCKATWTNREADREKRCRIRTTTVSAPPG